MFLFINFFEKHVLTENVINQNQLFFSIMIKIDQTKESLPLLKLEKDGVYDLKRLYKNMKGWFEENKYVYTEKENTTNIKDKGTEIKLTMSGERMVTDYFKFGIEVKFLIIESHKVRMKDKDLDKGKMLAFIRPTIYFDYRNIWAKNKFSKLLRYIYNNFIIKKQIDDVYSAALKYEADDLLETMKDSLEMYTK